MTAAWYGMNATKAEFPVVGFFRAPLVSEKIYIDILEKIWRSGTLKLSSGLSFRRLTTLVRGHWKRCYQIATLSKMIRSEEIGRFFYAQCS